MLGQKIDDRRHQVAAGDPVFLQRFEERLGLEARQDHQHCTTGQPEVHDYRHREDVKQRQHQQHAIVGSRHARMLGAQHQHVVGHQIAVGQHHPLAGPGGAARIGQHGQIASRFDRRRRRVVGRRAQPGEGFVAVGRVEYDDLPESAGFGSRPRVLEQRTHREQAAGAGVPHLPFELVGEVHRVDRRDDTAHAQDRLEGQHEFDRVAGVDRDHVALAIAPAAQRRIDRADLVAQAPVAQTAAAEGLDQRRAVEVVLELRFKIRGPRKVGDRYRRRRAANDHEGHSQAIPGAASASPASPVVFDDTTASV